MHLSVETDASALIRRAGLRPTRQRVSLAVLLFGNGDRHVTAEMLHEEAVRAGGRVSLATVYNTLHQFKRAGLLREIAIGGQRAYFDTNTSNHNHYFVEGEARLMDCRSLPRTSKSPISMWWYGWSPSSALRRLLDQLVGIGPPELLLLDIAPIVAD